MLMRRLPSNFSLALGEYISAKAFQSIQELLQVLQAHIHLRLRLLLVAHLLLLFTCTSQHENETAAEHFIRPARQKANESSASSNAGARDLI